MDWSQPFEHAYGLVWEKLAGWIETTIIMLPNLISALLILLFTIGVALGTRALFRHLLNRASAPPSVNRLISGLAYYSVFAVGLFVSLSVLKLDKTVTSLLAGAGVLGLALSFAFQDLAANIISGLFIAIQRPLRVNDLVKTHDYLARVQKIGIRALVLRDLDGQNIIIPSKDIFQSPLINYSTERRRRVNLDVGVSYASDLAQVEELTRAAVETVPDVASGDPVLVHWHTFGDSSINFTVRFWVKSSEEGDVLQAKSDALKAIKRTYNEHDITIPFPIRTLDFGIEGGQTATDAVKEIAPLFGSGANGSTTSVSGT